MGPASWAASASFPRARAHLAGPEVAQVREQIRTALFRQARAPGPRPGPDSAGCKPSNRSPSRPLSALALDPRCPTILTSPH